MKIKVYNQKGEVTKDLTLPESIFGHEFNEVLVHQALVRQLSNKRNPIAHTLTKGDVRGGGRKPFRQKGTGRARQGSTTNPIYPGGGVAFGPKNTRNFEKDMPKKMRRKALFCALSLKATEDAIFGLDKYEDKSLKTKNFVETLSKLPVERNVLLVTEGTDDNIKRVTSNLPNVKVVSAGYVNIHDLSKFRKVCFVGDSIKKVEEIFAK